MTRIKKSDSSYSNYQPCGQARDRGDGPGRGRGVRGDDDGHAGVRRRREELRLHGLHGARHHQGAGLGHGQVGKTIEFTPDPESGRYLCC